MDGGVTTDGETTEGVARTSTPGAGAGGTSTVMNVELKTRRANMTLTGPATTTTPGTNAVGTCAEAAGPTKSALVRTELELERRNAETRTGGAAATRTRREGATTGGRTAVTTVVTTREMGGLGAQALTVTRKNSNVTLMT